ncbi:hypothetical protein BOX15_Mlig018876g4, partial [Macrostomum lignano]
ECRNIEGNGDACVRLSTPCTPDEDACISHVHYTTPTSYWTPLAERKHYISKGCVSYSACIKQRDITQRSCTYDWFTDWSCVECCRGDLCNYYVTLSGQSVGPAFSRVALLTAASCLLRLFASGI